MCLSYRDVLFSCVFTYFFLSPSLFFRLWLSVWSNFYFFRERRGIKIGKDKCAGDNTQGSDIRGCSTFIAIFLFV